MVAFLVVGLTVWALGVFLALRAVVVAFVVLVLVPNSSSRFMQEPELSQEVLYDQTKSRPTRSSRVWLAGQEQLRQKNTTVFVGNFLTCYSRLFQLVATRIETPVRDLYPSVAAIRHRQFRFTNFLARDSSRPL